MSGAAQRAAPDITDAWMGTKTTMSKALLDITREGGKDTSFVTYHTDNDHLLIMEILDVKQCSWPEPSDKATVDLDVSCRCLSQSFAVHEATKNLSRDIPPMMTISSSITAH
ncbi:hypothetical protein ARMGADRAFT_529868 [Armillaria gallica]|uniref:Uncharacterized protein n=1 Tax=Armillaria gallica TaxID=47427 RepID=A0A2H3D6S7_ARMGA|nr:hypothetical protein ARMGADRAFT_529868 [Armillaria gallica]